MANKEYNIEILDAPTEKDLDNKSKNSWLYEKTGIAINKLDIYEFMSFATYYMHLIFGRIPSLMSSDLILYILPALTISILFLSLKIMFFKTPKLRKVK